VNSIYLDIRWVTTCFLVIIYHFHTLKWTVHWQVQPCLPCITVVGPCSTVQYRGSTVVGPCSTVSVPCRTVQVPCRWTVHYRAAPCRWLYHRRVADHGLSYIITFPLLTPWECGTKCRPITARIKININVLLMLQYTLKQFMTAKSWLQVLFCFDRQILAKS